MPPSFRRNTKQMWDMARQARMRVLLVGHACCPDLGSEPGLTWNWARHLAELHDITLLAHPLYRDRVEAALGTERSAGLEVRWVDLPARVDPWKGRSDERWIRLHYLLWQRAALREAHRQHAARPFDVTHHVSWGTVNAPPALWRIDAPFVWGPVGGGQTAPPGFRRYLGGGLLRESLRTVLHRVAPLSPGLRQAAARSAAVLATNRETADLLRAAGCRDVGMFLDNGVLPGQVADLRRTGPDRAAAGKSLDLLWVGRVEPRKALPLALEVMARVGDLPVTLTIAGDGPQRAECARLADAYRLDGSVRFLGRVPRPEVDALFARSDALLFTSLQDAFGSVVLEAMAAGLPVLCLDHQGVGAMVPSAAAIKVPVVTPGKVIDGLAAGIRLLLASPAVRRRMSAAAIDFARTETWPERARRISHVYSRCLEARHGHTPDPEDHRPGTLLPEALAGRAP